MPARDDGLSVRDAGGSGLRSRDERAPRTFVLVDDLRARPGEAAAAAAPAGAGSNNSRWSLWGDPDA
jgi:hypothetical protein